jgi:hypothetical protein
MRKKQFLIATVSLVLVLVFAYIFTRRQGTQSTSSFVASPRVQTFEQMKQASGAGVYVEDQPAGAMEVVVGFAVMPEGGFIVIHEDDSGVPGRVIGVSAVLAQGAEHLAVQVSPSLMDGAIYYALLYADPNEDPIKALAAGTARPLTDTEGNVVLMSFAASANAQPETEPVQP